MKINKLTFLAFQLNGALGSGRYDDVTVDEVDVHLQAGTIWEFLAERLGRDFDASIIHPLEKLELALEWSDMADALHSERTLCAERNGLCLLVAYLLEGIQRVNADIRAQRREAGLPLLEDLFEFTGVPGHRRGGDDQDDEGSAVAG